MLCETIYYYACIDTRNTVGLVKEATFTREHILVVNICYGVKYSKRMCTIFCQICHHSWRRLYRWVTEVSRRLVRKTWRKYARELRSKKAIMSLARKEKQCSLVPHESRGQKDEIVCVAIAYRQENVCMRVFLCNWFSANRINSEGLNYLQLKWNPNILPPWVNEWVDGWVSECVCLCVCVKRNFKTKVCFCN